MDTQTPSPFAGTLLFGGRVSVGIVLGASVIVLAPVLVGFYVRWTNRNYDAQVAKARVVPKADA